MVSTLRKLLLPFCLLCITGVGSAHAAPANNPLGSFLFTDGQINAILRVGGSIYVGGAFTTVRPYTGHGIALNVTTGVGDSAFPLVNGTIFAVLSDGANGWYIGGQFDHVGTVARNGLAHIKADKTLDTTWDPNPSTSAIVRTMFISGSTLYVAGSFSSLGGQARGNIAAVNISTGQPTSWAPNCQGPVRAILVPGNGNVYVGGAFQQDPLNPTVPTCGGQIRNHIAALDASTGLAVTSWNPNANLDVRVLALSPNSNKLYVGGNFTSISGQSRNHIAEIDLSNGTATSWNPNIDLQVLALKVSGSIVYVGGSFQCIGPATDPNHCSQTGGTPRDRIAALQVSNGTATGWNPDSNSSVESIAVLGNIVYVGGTFNPTLTSPNSIGGQPRNNIAALDASTGLATPWNPNVNNAVHTLALAGSTVYAGGEFDSAGGVTLRNNIAAFDATTGAVLPAFNPDVTGGSVLALAALANTLYFGGDFTCVGGTGATPCAGGGGTIRNRIASIDIPSGTLSGWAPDANGTVRTLAIANDAAAVYAGGDFTSIGGAFRNRIAALTLSAPVSAFPWNPGADNSVHTIVPALLSSGDKIYAGGAFTNIGGTPRPGLAFLKGKVATTNLLQNWNPGANGIVRTLLVGTPTICTTPSNPAKPDLTTPVYLGGDFTCLDGGAATPCSGGGGFSRNHLAAVKSSGSGTICNWNPGANNTVRALALSGNTVFAGGDFTNIGLGVSRNRLAALDTTSGSALSPISGEPGGGVSWNPNANNSVNVLAVADAPSPARLYVGGAFSTMAGSASIGLPRNNLAAFSFAPLVAAALPTSRSVQVGTTATAWALVVNVDTSTTVTGVGIAPNGFISPSDFSYQAFDPISAPPNTPINIPPGGLEVFLIAITPSTTLVPSLVPFIFEGTNTNAAPQFSAVNTLLFSASLTQTPDPIALAATTTGGGIVDIPGSTGKSFIAVATLNVGSGGSITAEANTGNVNLPVTLTICQTNPTTGACINPLTAGPSATMTIAAGEQDTFLVTVQGSGTIPFDPALNRILINFHGESTPGGGSTINGPVRGGTSVAVRTQ
jgi:hypothetical protein